MSADPRPESEHADHDVVPLNEVILEQEDYEDVSNVELRVNQGILYCKDCEEEVEL